MNEVELKRGTGLFLDDAINANVPGVFMERRTVSAGQQFNIRGYGNGVRGTNGVNSNFDGQGSKIYLNNIPITDAEGITLMDDIDFGTRLYEESGCASGNAVIKGLHLRGYSMGQKPFFQSMRDFWSGVNPIYNLGLKAGSVDDSDVIIIEESREFYPSDVSIQLSNVRNIKKSHDNEHYINQAQVGYEKSFRETVSGLDDPQTKRTWASRFKNIGRKLQLFSTWIAAGLTIEATRRNTILKSEK